MPFPPKKFDTAQRRAEIELMKAAVDVVDTNFSRWFENEALRVRVEALLKILKNKE